MQHIGKQIGEMGFQLQANKTISIARWFCAFQPKSTTAGPQHGLCRNASLKDEPSVSALSIRKILFRNYWILSWWKNARLPLKALKALQQLYCNCFLMRIWIKEIAPTWLSPFFHNFPETQPQLVLHEWRANHAALWAGGGAGEAQLGGALPQLHGGEGDARGPPPHRGQEAAGPVEVLHGRPGDRRPGHGKPLGKLLLPGGKQKHAGVSSSAWQSEYEKGSRGRSWFYVYGVTEKTKERSGRKTWGTRDSDLE